MTTRTLALLATLIAASPAAAQTFESGSDGSDGALTIAPNQGTLTFDPRNFSPALDPDGDGIYHFTTITVGINTTLRLSAAVLGEGRPVIWLATGAVTIDGVIDLNGSNGHSVGGQRVSSVAGAGGYSGGKGNDPDLGLPATAGNGPGGAAVSTGAGLGGGHVVVGGQGAGGRSYGNVFLLPLTGGSGGSGEVRSVSRGGGGGAGGGAILIASSTSLSLEGTVRANGGLGSGNGGHGSGGAIRLMAPLIDGSGSITARGSVNANRTGSIGRIRLEAFNTPTQLSLDPPFDDVSAPGPVLLPSSAPRISVASVASTPLPADPTGSAESPDVTITANTDVSIVITGANLPPGTTVDVTIQPESGPSVVVTGTLSGSFASSTATVTARLESGISRVIVRANWTP